MPLGKLAEKIFPQGDGFNLWRKFVLFTAIIQFFTFNIVCAVAHKGGFNGGKIGIFALPVALFVLILVIGIILVQVVKAIGGKLKKKVSTEQNDTEAGIVKSLERPTNTTPGIAVGDNDEPPEISTGWT